MAVRRHLDPLGRGDLAASLVLIVPLYLAYAVGILFSSSVNGVDFVTRHVWAACRHDRAAYLLFHVVVGAGFVWWVRHKTRHARSLSLEVAAPVAAEAAIYAVAMGTVIRLVMQHLLPGMSTGDDAQLGGAGERIVASLGAGVHEELVFRLGMMGGIGWLLIRAGLAPRLAITLAVVASSLLFSWAHHVGPFGDPWDLDVFVFRVLAGAVFALIFWFRSLAHAVYAHVAYDIWVLVARP